MRRRSKFHFIALLGLSLGNYVLAQFLAAQFFALNEQELGITIFWLLEIGFLLLIFLRSKSIFRWHVLSAKSFRTLIIWIAPIGIGLILFMSSNIHQIFHTVAYPWLFALIIPLAEEIIFRGIVFEKLADYSSTLAIGGSSVLFGLHHLQYYHFQLSRFALFQIAYTIILGLCLAKIRKTSHSLLPGLIIHMVINSCMLL